MSALTACAMLDIKAQRRIKVIALQEQEDALDKHMGLLARLIDNAADYVVEHLPILETLQCDTSAKRELIIAEIEALL